MNYNKEFLVPYLENICALYIAENRLCETYEQYRHQENRYSKHENTKAPLEPCYEPVSVLFHPGLLFMCIFMTVGVGSSIYCSIIYETQFALGISLFAGIPIVCFSWYWLYETVASEKYENVKKKEAYEAALKQVKENQRTNNWRDAQLPKIVEKRIKYKNEIDTVVSVREKMYDANIIPSHYRNMYVAVYLYDYFRTSQSTDLERALTLFVLEEIKSRLDRIIEQQSEMILNQQMMIAEQRKTREQQERYAKQMIAKLDNIITSNEERNTYLDMIEANTRATAYFAAAEYFR